MQRAEALEAAAPAAPPLGAISSFSGVFRGTGFNTIFRPQNAQLSPTPLPSQANGPDDNVLELNLTEETLSFSPALGSIPNRGFAQADIDLNGIPYLQTINDITDPANPVGIHFEPGVWLAVPATQAPEEGPTFARMASIPHGTTIDAQGTAFTVAGGPQIAAVDITPFPIGGSQQQNPIKFPSQTAADSNTFRLPQDLTPFITAGTITQQILDDPNTVLRTRAAAQNITSTTVIIIDTQPQSPLFGGGTDNIAFLLGDAAAAHPNADAVQMGAIFWIEVVTETITVPPLEAGRTVTVAASGGAPTATFAVTSPYPTTSPVQKEVCYTQLQNTQKVLLNFNGLSWPHVSVATLVPHDPIPVTLP
jgi:hypothetical protein